MWLIYFRDFKFSQMSHKCIKKAWDLNSALESLNQLEMLCWKSTSAIQGQDFGGAKYVYSITSEIKPYNNIRHCQNNFKVLP